MFSCRQKRPPSIIEFWENWCGGVRQGVIMPGTWVSFQLDRLIQLVNMSTAWDDTSGSWDLTCTGSICILLIANSEVMHCVQFQMLHGALPVPQEDPFIGEVVLWKLSQGARKLELIAAAGVVQESLAVRHVVEFLGRFNDPSIYDLMNIRPTTFEDFDMPGGCPGGSLAYQPVVLMSDSASALQVLRNDGLGTKVRHISLAIAFIQRLVQSEQLILQWIPTRLCVFDTLSKVLGKDIALEHAQSLGFFEVEGPKKFQYDLQAKTKGRNCEIEIDDMVDALTFSNLDDRFQAGLKLLEKMLKSCWADSVRFVLLDLCTSGRAGFAQVSTRFKKVVVISVTKDSCPLEICCDVLAKAVKGLCQSKQVIAWYSPPCTGGSPVLSLIQEPRRSEIQVEHFEEFKRLLACAHGIFEHCATRCLELSRCSTYWKDDEVVSFTQKHDLGFRCDVPRCGYKQEITGSWRCRCSPLLSSTVQQGHRESVGSVQLLLPFILEQSESESTFRISIQPGIQVDEESDRDVQIDIKCVKKCALVCIFAWWWHCALIYIVHWW